MTGERKSRHNTTQHNRTATGRKQTDEQSMITPAAYLLLLLAHHVRHLLSEVVYNVRVDLDAAGPFHQLVNAPHHGILRQQHELFQEVVFLPLPDTDPDPRPSTPIPSKSPMRFRVRKREMAKREKKKRSKTARNKLSDKTVGKQS